MSDSEEYDYETEPVLKYQRLGGEIPNILARETITALLPCAASSGSILVLGTKSGMVYIVDAESGELIIKLDVHTKTINDMSMDKNSDLLATCSDDGNVCISTILTREKRVHKYQRAVMTVSLSPEYKKDNVFATGGLNKQLIINTPFWFSNKDTVIHGGEGPVYAIAWQGQLIAWANDVGVKVYDYQSQERVTFIGRSGPPPAAYRCHLKWANNNTLLIGWAHSVKIGEVKYRPSNTNPKEMVKYIQIVAMFRTDFIISGIAPFDDHLILLAYVERNDSDDDDNDNTKNIKIKPERPELMIISRANEIIMSESLPMLGYEQCNANDYRLEYSYKHKINNSESTIDHKKMPSSENSIFYIMAPHDIVVGRPCDVDDHITWLLDQKQFEEALDLAQANLNKLEHHKLTDIGEKCLQYWFEEKEYDKVAENCELLLDNNIRAWETWLLVFSKAEQLDSIINFIPTKNPVLSNTIYEMILNHYLRHNENKFCELIHLWPDNIYNSSAIISGILWKLDEALAGPQHQHHDTLLTENNDSNNNSITTTTIGRRRGSSSSSNHVMITNPEELYKILADLYIKTREYNKALSAYLRLGRAELVFDLVNKLDLSVSIRDKVLSLMRLDEIQAIKLFVNNRETVPVETVVHQLKGYPKLQHAYLDALFQKDSSAGRQFHDLQVILYAKYDSTKLLNFLRNANSYYQLENALKICAEMNFYEEQVHILRRMGSSQKALRLIIEELHDVKQTIEFMEEDKDNSLWEEVITHSLKNSDFLLQLLDHVGQSQNVDLLLLMSRIPDDMTIPGLKYKVMNILSECKLQLSVRQGCNNILKRDCISLQQRLVRRAKRAAFIDMSTKCDVCNDALINRNNSSIPVSNKIFFCKHHFHAKCLEGHGGLVNEVQCPICAKNVRSAWNISVK